MRQVRNNYDEIARARAQILTKDTPLQYWRDGDWDSRRQAWAHIIVFLVMLCFGTAMGVYAVTQANHKGHAVVVVR